MSSRWKQLKYTFTGLFQHYAPKPTFSVNHIPDLTGRVVLVTGGYSGIGKEITRALLEHNATTYVAGRTRTKAESVLEELATSTGRTAQFLEVDLSSLASIRKAAAEFLGKEQELHVLFNNAAIMGVPIDQLTIDGYDMQFGTNALGPWYLTELLIPALLRGKETSADGYARVITTSSSGAYFTPLHWGTFTDTPERKKIPTMVLYFQSKLANAILATEAARIYGGKGIISISLNPGDIESDINRHQSEFFKQFASWVVYPATMGALTSLYAGTTPEALKLNGEFLKPWARVARCRDEVYDPEVGKRLWTWMEEQVRDRQ